MAEQKFTEQFREVTAKPVMEQAKFFLRAFVVDFAGDFESILKIGDEFLKFHGGDANVVNELDEQQAHYFLEKRGEAVTVKKMRETLKDIDIDNNNHVALIEYLLWSNKKTVADLFTPPGGKISQKLLDQLNESIEQYEGVLAAENARDEKRKALEAVAAKGGVKGMRAKQELALLDQDDETEKNRRRILAEAKKRKAQKAVDEDDGIDYEEIERRKKLDEEEQARVAAQEAAEEEERQRQAAESRRRLKEKAALWNN